MYALSSGALLNSVFQPVHVRHLHNRQQNMLTCCIFPASHIVLEQTIQQLSLTTFTTAHSKRDSETSDCFLAQLSLCLMTHTTHAGTLTYAQPETFTTQKTAARHKTTNNQFLKGQWMPT